jgi:1-acyl-sn-glycerol-3-phosphate acyltransferase
VVEREKGGPWVAALASVFYPLTYLARTEAQHAERIPRTGGAVIAMNHISHADPVFDAVFIHKQGRVPRFLAKASVMTAPVFGRMARGAGSIPVYRGTSQAKDALREAHQALRDGKVIVIYPEGTITKDPLGWPKNSYPGVAKLALANDVPVVPIARWGTRDLLDLYHKKIRPFPRKTVKYLVGEPVDLSAFKGQEPTPELHQKATEFIMAEVTRLLGQLRGEQPPPHAGKDTHGEDTQADGKGAHG